MQAKSSNIKKIITKRFKPASMQAKWSDLILTELKLKREETATGNARTSERRSVVREAGTMTTRSCSCGFVAEIL